MHTHQSVSYTHLDVYKRQVPFEQSEELDDKLIENGCDADVIALEGADHADMQFFQDELWDRIIEFFKTKLG